MNRVLKHSIMGILAIVILHFLFYSIRSFFSNQAVDSHVEKLTTDKQAYQTFVDQIKKEGDEKLSLVEKLNTMSSDLKNVDRKFLAETYSKEVSEHETTSFWQSFMVNFLFFALGAVIAFFSAKIIYNKRQKE